MRREIDKQTDREGCCGTWKHPQSLQALAMAAMVNTRRKSNNPVMSIMGTGSKVTWVWGQKLASSSAGRTNRGGTTCTPDSAIACTFKSSTTAAAAFSSLVGAIAIAIAPPLFALPPSKSSLRKSVCALAIICGAALTITFCDEDLWRICNRRFQRERHRKIHFRRCLDVFEGTCCLERTKVAVLQPSRIEDALPHSKMPIRSVIKQAWTQVDICNPHVPKDSCLPHHKHGRLTLEGAGRCLHMLLALK